MATSNFLPSLQFILRWEGGFVDNPNDPGGRTNRGVTQKVFNAWLASMGKPQRDVKTITDAEVNSIYQKQYWLPPRCDVLQEKLDLVQFDTAVNMGVNRAVRILQTALACSSDGNFGPGTLKAAQSCDASDTTAAYCQQRENIYLGLIQKNPKLAVFKKGWLNRLNALRAQAGVPGYPVSREFGLPDLGDADHILRLKDIELGEEADAYRP